MPLGSKNNVPYVYFDSPTITNLITANAYAWWFDGPSQGLALNAGVAVPYFDATTTIIQPDAFQIISAGVDDLYGITPTTAYAVGSPPPYRYFPIGPGGVNNWDILNLADDDNVTNFNAKPSLVSAKP